MNKGFGEGRGENIKRNVCSFYDDIPLSNSFPLMSTIGPQIFLFFFLHYFALSEKGLGGNVEKRGVGMATRNPENEC